MAADCSIEGSDEWEFVLIELRTDHVIRSLRALAGLPRRRNGFD
jgi:hypothetical protein